MSHSSAAGSCCAWDWRPADDVVETFSPGGWLSNYRWSPAVVVVELLRFPGIVLLWYSVLAVRVPHLREVVRASYRRLLARRGLLAGAATAPAVALVWLVASRPERSVGAVIADPPGAVAGRGNGDPAAGVRQAQAAADAPRRVDLPRDRRPLAGPGPTPRRRWARRGGSRRFSRTLSRTAERVCGSPVTLLLPTDAAVAAPDLGAPDGRMAPLARTSAIVHMLETAGGSLRVHPNDKTSIFALLPRATTGRRRAVRCRGG